MDRQYGGYADHIKIGHAGDALQVIDQILAEAEFEPESVRAVLEAVKEAIKSRTVFYVRGYFYCTLLFYKWVSEIFF